MSSECVQECSGWAGFLSEWLDHRLDGSYLGVRLETRVNVPASLNSGAAQAPPRVDRGASAAATKRLYELNRGEQALLVNLICEPLVGEKLCLRSDQFEVIGEAFSITGWSQTYRIPSWLYRGSLRGNWPEVLCRRATREFVVAYELLPKAI